MADEEIKADPKDELSPESTPDKAVEKASEAVENTEDRIAELEKRLTREGRSKAQIAKDKASLEEALSKRDEEIAKLRDANTAWKRWYLNNHASEDERRREVAKDAAEAQAKSKGEFSEVWKAIAKEEDPTIRKALVRLAEEADKAGESVSKSAIKALRESLAKTEDEEPEVKEPPKVGALRSTGAVSQTWDQRMAAAKKAKDTTGLMNLLAEKAKAESTSK